MRVIISLSPPKEDRAVAAYEAAIKAVAELGAVTTHASFTGRRYEEFDTFEAFKASFERHKKSVELAEPILRRHKVKLAIENHKGWRAAEHAAWVKRPAASGSASATTSATTSRSARIRPRPSPCWHR